MTETNEREAAQLERPRVDIPPAVPTLMVVGIVGDIEPGRAIGYRGMRPVDPVKDAEMLRAAGWVRAKGRKA